jgi:Tol biopolymer transport system component
MKSTQSKDIIPELAKQPIISPDGSKVMYIRLLPGQDEEWWIANVDGTNRIKVGSSGVAGTGDWSADSKHLAFLDGTAQVGYVMTAEGRNAKPLKHVGSIGNIIWSKDGKYLYISADRKIYQATPDGTRADLLADKGFVVTDTTPDARYIIGKISAGDRIGIYSYSFEDKKVTCILPEVVTYLVKVSPDGKYLLYATEGSKEIYVYRAEWKDGKVGEPQIIMKVPFAFAFEFDGNAYDYTRDLSKIIFTRPTQQADVYLLSY